MAPNPETFDEFIAHHGIKGMKWGVRRDNPSPSGGGGGRSPKKDREVERINGGGGGGGKPVSQMTKADRRKGVNISTVDGIDISVKGARTQRGFDKNAKKAIEEYRRKPTPEAKVAMEALKRAHKHGTQTLSNKDLEDLNRRLNLEKTFGQLSAGGKKRTNVQKALAAIDFAVKVNDGVTKLTGQSVINLMAGKAAAAATKGASGATKASTGTSKPFTARPAKQATSFTRQLARTVSTGAKASQGTPKGKNSNVIDMEFNPETGVFEQVRR